MKLLALVALVIAGSAAVAAPASGATPLPRVVWDFGITKAVSADVVASTSLPDGSQVYVFGDTMSVNRAVICSPTSCPFGYPHSSVAIERHGSANFVMQSCSAFGCPYGWQWVPNWPDGSYFWMAAPAVLGKTLYVVGMRTTTTGSGCSFGCSEGEYVASFAIGPGDALTYKEITQLTGTAGQSQWGAAVADLAAGGWWLTGTRNTGASGCFVDCKTMDVAFVPFTAILDATRWRLSPGVLPSGQGWDVGTVASLVRAGSHWVIFTKQNDIIGSAIEELSSRQVTSGWSQAGSFAISPIRGCTLTYSVQAHTGDGAPSGEMLVFWANNGNATGATCPYEPRFRYLPVR
ncbi:MAG TPA: hypothetical protein VKR21_05680 [Solirubrobacteraceae bacterium]|nr:hypothetical protein [Solirubrobacteraceae bacterium]